MVEFTLPVPVERSFSAQVEPLARPIADGTVAAADAAGPDRHQARERLRADFVANVSHELKTPLASLIGFIETLRGPAAEDGEARQSASSRSCREQAAARAPVGRRYHVAVAHRGRGNMQAPTGRVALLPILQAIDGGAGAGAGPDPAHHYSGWSAAPSTTTQNEAIGERDQLISEIPEFARQRGQYGPRRHGRSSSPWHGRAPSACCCRAIRASGGPPARSRWP